MCAFVCVCVCVYVCVCVGGGGQDTDAPKPAAAASGGGRRRSIMQLASTAIATAASSPLGLRRNLPVAAAASPGRAAAATTPRSAQLSEHEQLRRAVLAELDDTVKAEAEVEVSFVEVNAAAGPALLEVHCLWSHGVHAASIVATAPSTLLLLNRSLISLLRGIVPAAVDGARVRGLLLPCAGVGCCDVAELLPSCRSCCCCARALSCLTRGARWRQQ